MTIRKPRIYTGREVDLNIFEQIWRWIRGYGWSPTKYVFQEISPDDLAYENAPYEETFVYMDGGKVTINK